MSVLTATMENLDSLVARHFSPGSRVVMYLGLPRELTAEELVKYQKSLEVNGAQLAAPVEIGEYGDWAHALKVEIAAPAYSGVGVLPLAVLLILALGAVGIVAYTGVKLISIVDVIKQMWIPTLLIGGGIFLMYAYMQSKKPVKG